ncbi:unnamed protein product, partial [marine sediment metagenome]
CGAAGLLTRRVSRLTPAWQVRRPATPIVGNGHASHSDRLLLQIGMREPPVKRKA